MHDCIIQPQELFIQSDESIISSVEDTIKKTILDYSLITPEDKVLVAVSGGKDSTACLHILKKLGYNVEAFTVDVHIGCYTKQNLQNVKTFCASENVKLHVFSFRKSYGHSVCHARDTLNNKGINVNSCTVCGVMRRRLFNIVAKKIGATKLATGHNMDDEVQTILMNLFKNRQTLNARINPLQHFNRVQGFIPRIKPLFFVPEKDIIAYTKALKFPVHYGRCPCSVTSLRSTIRDILNTCTQINPAAVNNIMHFFFQQINTIKTNVNLHQNKTLILCTHCGEPSSTGTCRTCQLLRHLEIST